MMSLGPSTQTDLSRRLEGEVAVVTGGSQGIGLAIVERLASEGAAVAVLARTAANVHAVADEVNATGGRALGIACDVTDRGQVRSALDRVVEQFGSITILVNHAGMFRAAPFLEMSDAMWHEMLSVNLTSMFVVGQEAARRMIKPSGGRIVNMASAAAHIAHSDQTAYAVTKAGIEAMTRTMAFELAPLGIIVNAVAPGTIQTSFSVGALSSDAVSQRVRRIPLGRLGAADEVAAVIAFLASPDASYMTGSIVHIDGGLTIAGVRSPSVTAPDERKPGKPQDADAPK